MTYRLSNTEAKKIVTDGYNQISSLYASWQKSVRAEERKRYTDLLMNNLPLGAKVLELGCGNGDPTTKKLTERFSVVGVDISEKQIQGARKNVPEASFIQGDMTCMKFQPYSFDAVVAFYSITHVPRRQHAALLLAIAEWLKPGGILVASMSVRSNTGAIEDNWLGVPMYFSGYTVRTNKHMVKNTGFEILRATKETAVEFGLPCSFLWIVARKPRSDTSLT